MNTHAEVERLDHLGIIAGVIKDLKLVAHIEQFGCFIFDLSIFNAKFVKTEVIGSAMTVNFENLP